LNFCGEKHIIIIIIILLTFENVWQDTLVVSACGAESITFLKVMDLLKNIL